MIKKSVISLISYDAHYLPKSIERYYNYVDEIVLGLDKNRQTWSKNSFSFDESLLWSELSRIDGDKKISIVEEDFVQSDVAIENDNYERNFLKNECSNDWIFSFDADEMLVNPKHFFYEFCPLVEDYRNTHDICMTWATPYKEIENTTLVIAEEDGSPFFGENQGVVTSKNNTYTYARWTNQSAGGTNRILSPLVALHYSLCRKSEDLHQKIHNIGHSDIVEEDPFYKIWTQVTMDNYKELKNFKTSGLGGAQWPSLEPIETQFIFQYIEQYLNKAY
jgi:hypothetical protein